MIELPSEFEPIVNGLSGEIGLRKNRVQFGEGYSQASLAGVNPRIQQFTLDFIIWGDDQLNRLVAFLETVGAGTIAYQLPNETEPKEYEIVGLPSVSYLDKMQRRVSVQLRSAY